MPILSLHVLDAVGGTHAAELEITLDRVDRDDHRLRLFTATTDHEGRLRLPLALPHDADGETRYELRLGARVARRHGWDPARIGPPILGDVCIPCRLPPEATGLHFAVTFTPSSHSVLAVVRHE